jgi:BirA family biotin operon repressor/biotin-[acetyl-CoA-carboxylase] ligase
MRELSIEGFERATIVELASSTMDLARDSLMNLRGGYGVVCARTQTAGRGRQGRSWASSTGALMATFSLPVPYSGVDLSGYSLVIGVAIARALRPSGAPISLKWPNDVVVVRGDLLAKMGGILVEVHDGGAGRYVLVGFGLNMDSSPEGVAHATSLVEAGGDAMEYEACLKALAAELLDCHRVFLRSGFAGFREEWERVSCFQPESTFLRLDVGEREVAGTYLGIEDSGALKIQGAQGTHTIFSAHVLEVRGARAACADR